MHEDCGEPQKEKSREAWRKIRNIIFRGEKYATTTANFEKRSDAWHVPNAMGKQLKGGLQDPSRGTIPQGPHFWEFVAATPHPAPPSSQPQSVGEGSEVNLSSRDPLEDKKLTAKDFLPCQALGVQ